MPQSSQPAEHQSSVGASPTAIAYCRLHSLTRAQIACTRNAMLARTGIVLSPTSASGSNKYSESLIVESTRVESQPQVHAPSPTSVCERFWPRPTDHPPTLPSPFSLPSHFGRLEPDQTYLALALPHSTVLVWQHLFCTDEIQRGNLLGQLSPPGPKPPRDPGEARSYNTSRTQPQHD